MNTEITDKNAKEPVGWIFYDGECGFCVRGMECTNRLFARRGFCWLPLQTPGTAERLRISDSDLREEMKVLLAGGKVLGGVDAWIALFRSVWWLLPVGVFIGLPGIHRFATRFYRWLAGKRYCISGHCELRKHDAARNRHSAFFEIP